LSVGIGVDSVGKADDPHTRADHSDIGMSAALLSLAIVDV